MGKSWCDTCQMFTTAEVDLFGGVFVYCSYCGRVASEITGKASRKNSSSSVTVLKARSEVRVSSLASSFSAACKIDELGSSGPIINEPMPKTKTKPTYINHQPERLTRDESMADASIGEKGNSTGKSYQGV